MAEVDINDLATFGAIADMPPYMLPPEAWTQALNMRADNGGLIRSPGWATVFGTPTVAPQFLFPVSSVSTNFWVYAGLQKIYVYDGSAHTNITRQTASVDVDYTVAAGKDWNGTLLGGILVLNNGTDIPQFWSSPSAAVKMANLTNWNANVRAKIIRAFGPFLMAFGLTVTGTAKPHFVRWSHPADPGSVPASWDETDDTKDTGEVELPDVQAGIIQDALPLGSIMYIYKERSIYKTRFVGGRKIFDFGDSPWLTSLGLIAPRCVALTGDGSKHVLVSPDGDIVWHDGNRIRSLLTKRQKSRLAAQIDSSAFDTSFLFSNTLRNEMWFCYPSSGASFPDSALILNYAEGNENNWCITEMDGITFRHAATGPIENPSTELWSDGTDTWDQDTGPWAVQDRLRVVTAGAAATKLYKLDEGTSRDGTAFIATLKRESLSILGRNRKTGDWIVDHHTVKLFQRLWPKLQGSPVHLRVGTQELVNGAITWGESISIDPGGDITGDAFPCAGRALSLEFTWPAGTSGRIDGYKLEIEPLSEHMG